MADYQIKSYCAFWKQFRLSSVDCPTEKSKERNYPAPSCMRVSLRLPLLAVSRISKYQRRQFSYLAGNSRATSRSAPTSPRLGLLNPNTFFHYPASDLSFVISHPRPRYRSIATMADSSTTQRPVQMTHHHAEVLSSNIEKPELDDRSYRLIRLLDNKLETLLVHDPKTEKSSAAMDVHVGHLSDPKDFPGLAHALEHCLFLGKIQTRRPV